jgi:undecaprenyl-diphosphatase
VRAIHAALRWIRGHVRGFHAAVGAFLTLGLALILLALLAFAGLAVLVSDGAIQRFDEAVLLWMHRHAAPELDRWAEQLTALGSSVVVVTIVLVASAFLWATRHHYSVGLLWVAMLGSAVLNYTLKEAFGRPRPELWDRMYAGHASFPSGHAMSAVVIYGTLGYLVMRLEPTRTLRRLTLAVTLLVIVLIGASRLYLGVHYPSDVLAGYVLAVAWVTFCALGIEAARYFRDRRPQLAREEKGLERGADVEL